MLFVTANARLSKASQCVNHSRFTAGIVKGQSLSEITQQYKAEGVEASFGTALLWTPVCVVNFLYVPQHSRILVVSVVSFIHKTWMSWLSNRQRHRARVLAEERQES